MFVPVGEKGSTCGHSFLIHFCQCHTEQEKEFHGCSVSRSHSKEAIAPRLLCIFIISFTQTQSAGPRPRGSRLIDTGTGITQSNEYDNRIMRETTLHSVYIPVHIRYMQTICADLRSGICTSSDCKSDGFKGACSASTQGLYCIMYKRRRCMYMNVSPGRNSCTYGGWLRQWAVVAGISYYQSS